MAWSVEYLNEVVEQELDELPADIRARFIRISTLIIENGLLNVGMPYLRHLHGPLWEMRMRGKDGIARAIFVTVSVERVVVVRAFVKKTQKTPIQEIRLALARSKGLK